MTELALPVRNKYCPSLLAAQTWLRLFLGCVALAASCAALADPVTRPVRVGMTPAFLHDRHGLLAEWRLYMEDKLGRPVIFVQRDSYSETMDLLRLEKLDFAWICDYPYLHLKNQVRLLAVPLYQGKPYYRSYFIVPASDTRTRSLPDLKGMVFAYADPYSNTGYLVPRYDLRQLGEDPARFFRKTFFTWSHRKVVEAVAQGLAQGGAVDGFIWDTLALTSADLTRRTRIVAKSPEYGFPPFVAHNSVSTDDYAAMRKLLIGMADDAEGARLLKGLNIDGFIPGERKLYDRVAAMMYAFGEE